MIHPHHFGATPTETVARAIAHTQAINWWRQGEPVTLTLDYLPGSGPERASITLDLEPLAADALKFGSDRALIAAMVRELGHDQWEVIGSEWSRAINLIVRAAYPTTTPEVKQ